jgi:acetolactate synthase-1/2/3 large subunit
VIGATFQETPMVEVCRGIEAPLSGDRRRRLSASCAGVHIATTSRPGPVPDIPKDVQQFETVADFDVPMNLPGYHVEDRRATPDQIKAVAAAIKRAKKPVVYAGGGIIAGEASPELRAFVKKTGIPV